MQIQDFIGKTRIIGQVIATKIPSIHQGNTSPLERRLLFTGPPGVGKSALGKTLSELIAGHPLNIDRRIGSLMSVDIVRDWMQSAPYRPLMGRMYVKLVNEIESTPAAALMALRDYLDELPPSVAFIATTNRAVEDLQEQLQSRFKVHYFTAVTTDELAAHIAKLFPEIPAAQRIDLARQSSGNVRAALQDADSAMDVIRYRQLAA